MLCVIQDNMYQQLKLCFMHTEQINFFCTDDDITETLKSKILHVS